MRSKTVGLLVALVVAGCTTVQQPAPRPSMTPSPSRDTDVPALTVENPAVAVNPATNLVDGQSVTITLTGFGVGGKVFLSECTSVAVATSLGCGTELARQPFLVTDDSRAGTGTFTVRSTAAAGPQGLAPIQVCTESCVIVATLGNGYAFVTAPISFAAP